MMKRKLSSELQACIFDLDGVIVDTAKYHFLAWIKLAKDLGSELTIVQNEQLKGVSRIDSLNLILEWSKMNKSDAQKEQLCIDKNNYYLKLIENLSVADTLPGIPEILHEMAARNIKIGLGSASKNAVAILTRLGLLKHFKTIVDGNIVSNGKPDPETFELVCHILEVEPQRCIVFEDAIKGIEAAKAGGMIAVGIGNPQILKNADLVIPSFQNYNLDSILELLSTDVE